MQRRHRATNSCRVTHNQYGIWATCSAPCCSSPLRRPALSASFSRPWPLLLPLIGCVRGMAGLCVYSFSFTSVRYLLAHTLRQLAATLPKTSSPSVAGSSNWKQR
ncbi:hypothetical protein BU26DRAFT_106184 [Trematosphaeria pertusa]|uniref:Uncharacterized protein n=1 Tax=Trematosphaeria pertusa TaxID=390896 RepID=A0A6A6HZL1_9PLEO|nr:uncharacterized protein BU26DRAFT_106184 [Trematosphaeria pertusa]KAF2243635.1 hypothetical protein BU26DRAFT_106184 [Trematosphaeria pertusa]